MNLRPLTDTLVYLRDQRWKDVRRVISPTFSGRQMRHISSIVNCCVDILIQVVDDQQHGDIEFHGLFQGLTCRSISHLPLSYTSVTPVTGGPIGPNPLHSLTAFIDDLKQVR